MKCVNCAAEMEEGVKFCINCGTPMQAEQPEPVTAAEQAEIPADGQPATEEIQPEQPAEPAEQTMPPIEEVLPALPTPEPAQEQPLAEVPKPGLVGWSDKINAPEITKKASRRYKTSRLLAQLLATAIVIASFLLGLFVEAIPATYTVIAGLVLAVIVMFVNSRRTRAYTQPAWEGEVIDKKVIQKKQKSADGNQSEVYYLYKTIFRTTFGKKKSYTSEDMYTYLRIGEKVRFHPSLQYFEKFDKSRDLNIYCCVCGASNPIENDACLKCKSQLIKP